VSSAPVSTPGSAPLRPDEIEAVPVRHPGRWVAAVIVLVVAVAIGNSMATNKRFEWGVVGHYLFDPRILHGVVVTIELTLAAQAIGIVLGVLIAVMRLSPNKLVSSGSWLYVWFFRGTPVLVQLLFWYGVAALYPTIHLGIPFGPQFININANTAITPFMTVVLALGLNEGAYMSEIVRAGIISVDDGQNEAALSLGMTRLQTMRRIVLPQAMRVILPPTGNETISMLKTTSLAYVVAGTDLLSAAENIAGATYQVIQLLIVASLWYLVLTSVLYVGQYYLERYFARGASRELPPTPLQRIRRGSFSVRHDALAMGSLDAARPHA
jgi:polar amino acid transport system permease protein